MMLEEILSWKNLEQALSQVERNGGVCGVDGMQTDKLRDFLHTHYASLVTQLKSGIYEPQLVKVVHIPKSNGGTRKLGIPTVLDRVIQQSISQRLSSLYELEFSENSYGFRKGRNAQMALTQAEKYLNAGKTYIVELDLAQFFDVVNHDRLISVLRRKVSDERIISLIRKYLRSGIMEGGVTTVRTEGTPQGSPLSPLLSNIVLDELDQELHKRGHNFVRYADDISIYKSSLKSAQRVILSMSDFIENKLRLKVNTAKSKLSHPSQSKLLGFSFYKDRQGWQVRIHKDSVKRIKDKIRAISKRNMGTNLRSKIEQLRPVVLGWVNYFKRAKGKGVMQALSDRRCG